MWLLTPLLLFYAGVIMRWALGIHFFLSIVDDYYMDVTVGDNWWLFTAKYIAAWLFAEFLQFAARSADG